MINGCNIFIRAQMSPTGTCVATKPWLHRLDFLSVRLLSQGTCYTTVCLLPEAFAATECRFVPNLETCLAVSSLHAVECVTSCVTCDAASNDVIAFVIDNLDEVLFVLRGSCFGSVFCQLCRSGYCGVGLRCNRGLSFFAVLVKRSFFCYCICLNGNDCVSTCWPE